MELTELEVAHIVETINQAIKDSDDLYDGLTSDTIDALKECLEILGEPYESDD